MKHTHNYLDIIMKADDWTNIHMYHVTVCVDNKRMYDATCVYVTEPDDRRGRWGDARAAGQECSEATGWHAAPVPATQQEETWYAVTCH